MADQPATTEEATTVDNAETTEVDHSDIDIKKEFENLRDQLEQLRSENEELRKNSTQTSEMKKREDELKKFIAGFTGRGSAPTREAHQEIKEDKYVSAFEKIADSKGFDLSI